MADNRDNRTPDKDPQNGNSNPWMKSLFIWAGILLALILFVQIVDGGSRGAGSSDMAYSEFLNRVDEGSVKSVAISKEVISGKLTNGEAFRTNAVPDPSVDSTDRRPPCFATIA